MSADSDARAVAKRIGEDVELLVAEVLEGVHLIPDSTVDWYDAVATVGVFPPQPPTVFGGICLIWRGAPVEIKACSLSVSNGDGNRHGRWLFKGRYDGQHQKLVDANGIYALAVYREADAYLGKEVVGLMVIPAATVDDHLKGSWYDSRRREGQIAQLSWSKLLDDRHLLSGGEGS